MKFAAPLLLFSLFLASRCAETQTPGSPARYVSYSEKIAEEERLQRKEAGLVALLTTTPDPADSLKRLEVAIDSFDTEGHQVFNRTFGADGNSIKEIHHRYLDGRLAETRQSEPERAVTVTYSYNAEGRKTAELVVDASGDTLVTRTFVYDAVGNEIEASFYRKANQSRLKKRSTYDAQGRPATVQELSGETVNWEERYTYTDTLQTTERSANGQVQVIYHMRFDKLGHATSLKQLAPDLRPRTVVQMRYDDKGRMLEEVTTGPEGNPVSTFSYTYDAKGTRASRSMQRPDLQRPLLLRYEPIYR
jgi:hypothetical protein